MIQQLNVCNSKKQIEIERIEYGKYCSGDAGSYSDAADCFFIIYGFTCMISIALTVLIWCKLFGKSGYSWAFGFLMLVPVANIIVPFYLAFSDWPILKKLREYEQSQ